MVSKRGIRNISLTLIALLLLVISTPESRVFPLKSTDFEEGDRIPLFANRVQSLNNPCKSYPYFELPFCPPGDPIIKRKKSLDEVLAGNCFTNTQYELKFKVNTIGKALCEKNLTKDEVAKFRYAVKNKFEYDMYYNNILLRDYMGIVEENTETPDSSAKCYIFQHIRFDVFYSGNQVKHIYASSNFENAVDITEDAEISINFSYSVFWRELKISPANFDLWSTRKLGGWELFSLVDVGIWLSRAAFVFGWIILVLSVPVLYIRNYLTRYSHGAHDDGCRCPAFSSLLGAFLGIGTQKLIMICTLFVLAYNDKLNRYAGAMHAYISLAYFLTSAVAGFIATFIHSRFSPIGWEECIFQTGTFYLVPTFVTVEVLNYRFPRLPGLQTSDAVTVIWGFRTVISLFLGGTIAHYFRSENQTYCATERIKMPISQQHWFFRTPVQMFLGGLLPFIGIFGEMDSIYASLWNQKVCGAFITLLVAFLVVFLLTVLVGMSFTYYQLSNIEDYNGYWWRYVLRGGSTAMFMFAYGIYFHAKTTYGNEVKFMYFMAYTACLCYGFFLALETVGFVASSIVFYSMHKAERKQDQLIQFSCVNWE